ncbi:hypothetical protein [Kocuria sp. ZOR0020]|uniref:hypothetical protein n=1 Tax=Kocuria sp. ZOR0020 TaxID=1339234 RepID=UPI0012DFF197|nr:hypothetical protein [Kocuria sp. ZOR0020]
MSSASTDWFTINKEEIPLTNAPQDPQYPQQPQNPQYSQNAPYAQGGNKYGTAGYDPNQNFEMTQPPRINRWFQVTVASLVLFLVYSALGVAMLFHSDYAQLFRDQFAESGQTLPQGMNMDDMVAASQIGGAVFLIIFALLGLVIYALVLLGIKKRWNWARILGIVVAILTTLYFAWNLISSLTMASAGGMLAIVSIVVLLILVLVNVYWLILAFNRSIALWMSRRA